MAIARLCVPVALIALLAPAAAECQSDPAPWRFVHPNAKSLISVNWQRIRQSPAGSMIRDQWLNAFPTASIPGLELLDEIDRVVISSPGDETPADAAGDDVQTPLLYTVRGHFDAARLRQLFTRLGGKAQAYNSFQVYRPQGKDAKNVAYVQFDAGTILFGDAPSLFAALDRNRFAPPALEPGSIIARAADMDAAYDVSWVMNTAGMQSSHGWADLFHGDEWAPDAQGFEAGVNLRSGLAADVTVRFESEAAAKRVAAEMTKLIAVLSKDKTADLQMQNIARKLKFSSEGSAAKISLRLTPQELDKSARALMATHQVTAKSEEEQPGKAAPSAQLPPAPVKPGVIRIEGLDDGPREIPFPDHQN